MVHRVFGWAIATGLGLVGCAASQSEPPLEETQPVLTTRWSHQPGHEAWNAAGLAALETHAAALTALVPGDIATWCPDYANRDADGRAAFWVGFMSALAKHESTYNPTAVGGGNRWFGLVQISPATARGYQCEAGTGAALTNGAANVSCGLRIMAVTVPRDGVISARDSKWRGVAADWGPMRSAEKRADMAGWLSQQSYCQPS